MTTTFPPWSIVLEVNTDRMVNNYFQGQSPWTDVEYKGIAELYKLSVPDVQDQFRQLFNKKVDKRRGLI